MKRTLALLAALAGLAWAAVAPAVVDPTPDGVGIYFDLVADTYVSEAVPYVPFTAYVVLTNPAHATFTGLEFHYRLDTGGNDGLFIRLTVSPPAPILCLDCIWDPIEDSVRLTTPTPMPTAPATVLMTWHCLVLAPFGIDFYLAATPFTGPDTGQLAYQADGTWHPMTVRSGDPALPVAWLIDPPLATGRTTFAGLKALYR
ncbi:hypothetical protein KDM41_13695 [bacterium]|nr:hypothetical protein [bacterium]